MNAASVPDSIDALTHGGEVMIGDQVLESAARLADLAEAAPRATDPETAIAVLDEPLNALLIPAVTLVAYGSPEPGIRCLLIAVEMLACRTIAGHGQRLAIPEAVLGRVVLSLSAVALSYRRPQLLTSLESVRRSDGYGAPAGLVSDSSIRHLSLYENDARRAYEATRAWWMSSPWRQALAPVSSDDAADVALGEADVLCCCVQAAKTGRDQTFSAAVTRRDRRVADRILGRLADPAQRAAFCDLLGVTDAALDDSLGAAYALLSSGSGFHRAPRLFEAT